MVGVDRPIKALSLHIQKPLRITKGNQRTNGPVNAHLISWPRKAQNIPKIYGKEMTLTFDTHIPS